MGVYLKLVQHDRLFKELSKDPIVLNDLPSVTEVDKRHIDTLTSHTHEGDLMSNEPSCECGVTKGGYNIGVTCKNCRTQVREAFSDGLQPLVWLRAPEGVVALINPTVLTMLSQQFTKSNFDFIEWICNPSYTDVKGTRAKDIALLLNSGIERGYNNFILNFDRYIEILFSCPLFKDKEKSALQELLVLEKKCIFSNHIPLPNKAILVVEQGKAGIYVDKIIAGAIDAIKMVRSIDTPIIGLSLKQKENRTAKALFELSRFYTNFYKEFLASKTGVFRRHIYGTRNNYSMRAVISSNTKEHSYDELHLPWAASIVTFKLHLANKLINRGYTVNEVDCILQACSFKATDESELLKSWHKLIRELFDELLAETRDGCLYVYWNRNPSLTRASCQRMRVTKIKTDADDPTITMSILAVKGFNAKKGFNESHVVS